MTHTEHRHEQGMRVAPAAQTLTRIGMRTLWDFAERNALLAEALGTLIQYADPTAAKSAAELRVSLAEFEPSITFIGQVKSGKTTLINAMLGLPDLLPADVNPWTSVVTALHVTPFGLSRATRASFQFFGEEDWERLFAGGGRLGELAKRAGADEEVVKVQSQLSALRENARQRLGHRFELLLNQRHDYAAFDRALIERYVVLGDAESQSDDTGRFADITRTADLWLERPDIPIPLCIRDTPGVNDTFMIREQITLGAIRDSRLCVVVLSAHQALTSVDLALVRLVSTVKSREVIIFVNRIDELADPAAQVAEIEASIRATLKEHDGPQDCCILFGSAAWAGRALSGALKGMPKASAETLVRWSQAYGEPRLKNAGPEQKLWELSGLHDLLGVISQRIASGEGHEAMRSGLAAGANMLAATQVSTGSVQLRAGVEAADLAEQVEQILHSVETELMQVFAALDEDFRHRLYRAHEAFLDRAVAALIAHVSSNSASQVWTYDPRPLRVMLRTACQIYAAHMQRQVSGIYFGAAQSLSSLWRTSFIDVEAEFQIHPPSPPNVPPPVQLGQTLVLDLSTSWWKRWWQKQRGSEGHAAEYRQMISSETEPILSDLASDLGESLAEQALITLRNFIEAQGSLLFEAAASTRGRRPVTDASRAELDHVARLLAELEARS